MYEGMAQRASLSYKFTGKERDTESGLDHFTSTAGITHFSTPTQRDKTSLFSTALQVAEGRISDTSYSQSLTKRPEPCGSPITTRKATNQDLALLQEK